MAVDVTDANAYFDENILHNDEWVNADDPKKTRALNQAEKMLYRHYFQYDPVENPIPDEAVFEQALWLLRIDDTIRRAEQGVKSVMVDGMMIQLAQVDRSISPAVISILGRRVGRSSSGRVGYNNVVGVRKLL